jgi:hypothetical protein
MALVLRCARRRSKDEGQPILGSLPGCGCYYKHLNNRMFLRRA